MKIKGFKILLILCFAICLFELANSYSINVESMNYNTMSESNNNAEKKETEISKNNQEEIKKEEESKKENVQEEQISPSETNKEIKNDVVKETLPKASSNQNKTTEPTKTKAPKIDTLDKIKNSNEVLGTLGRLYIPSVNINVAVYKANVMGDENYNAQTIVDNKDSAAYYKLGNKYIIADHNFQGFNRLYNIEAGVKAYIKQSDGKIATYKLKNKFIGQNISYDLTNKEGTSIQNLDGELVIYTCYTSSKIIMVTMWDLANE